MQTSLNGKNRQYLPCLDLIRIFATVSTFIFHTYWNMNGSYGELSGFAAQANCCMSLFFILSGFSITYTSTTDLASFQDKLRFYKRRLKSLAPEYVLLLVWSYLLGNNSKYSSFEALVAAPYDVLPIFTTINFTEYGMHAGTWFIADIAICYVLYPLLKQALSERRKCEYIYTICGLYILRVIPLVFPYVLPRISTSSVYVNPFLRTLEFAFGVCLASIFTEGSTREKNYPNVLFWVSLALSTFGLNWLAGETNSLDRIWGLFIVVMIPIYGLMVYSGASYTGRRLKHICSTHIVHFMSKISYDFWLATFFTQSLSNAMGVMGRTNAERIVLLFAVNTCFTLILYALSKLLVHACEKIQRFVRGGGDVCPKKGDTQRGYSDFCGLRGHHWQRFLEGVLATKSKEQLQL